MDVGAYLIPFCSSVTCLLGPYLRQISSEIAVQALQQEKAGDLTALAWLGDFVAMRRAAAGLLTKARFAPF